MMKLSIDDTNAALLGETLKKLRKSCGYSQTVVADYLGVNRSTYTKYELGRAPDISKIIKLSSLYNIAAESLISVFFGKEPDFSGISALSSSGKDSAVYMLTKEEQMLVDYFRNSLRKDVIVDFAQSVYLEDCEEVEDE